MLLLNIINQKDVAPGFSTLCPVVDVAAVVNLKKYETNLLKWNMIKIMDRLILNKTKSLNLTNYIK